MSKIGYDPNSPLTVMEQVQNIIKPPPNEEEKIVLRPTNIKHPYYKRPGRGHNHDLCDACEEGGDLLCCDRCPSSFHLQCHDPPLTEDDIPIGQWMCHNCRMTLKPAPCSKASSVERAAAVAAATTGGGGNGGRTETSRPNTPLLVGADLDTIPLKLRSLRKRSNSRASFCSELSSTEKYLSKLPVGIQKALDPNKKPTPLDELIKAASMLNPKQFELPRELEIHSQFPGNDKVEPIRNNGNGNKKLHVRRNSKPFELDSQGLVPLPAKTCFYCRKSCKKAPLVACDYCPLYFHQDCLDPPMTAFPTGLWMCPNHVENFIDNNLVHSIAASERVRLWDKFSQPLEHESVKMEFFRRVHMKNPPFRIKMAVRPRETIEIPPMVKYHYENPPPLLPSLRDTLRYDIVKRRKCLPSSPEIISKESVAESLVKDLKALQSAKAKFREIQKELGNVADLSSSSSDEELVMIDAAAIQEEANINNVESIAMEEDSKKKLVAQKTNKKRAKRGGGVSAVTAAVVHVDGIQLAATVHMDAKIKSEDEHVGSEQTSQQQQQRLDDIKMELDDTDEDDVKYQVEIDAELRYLEVDLIKKLAYQRLQQLTTDHPEIVTQYQNRTASKRIRELSLKQQKQQLSDNDTHIPPSSILAPEDVRRLCIMFTGETSSILAQHQNDNDDGMPQLHPALATAAAIVAADEEEQKYAAKMRTDGEKAYEIATRLELKLLRRKIRTRAVLTPLGDLLEDNRWFSNVELNSSFFMRYRNFHIGYGSGGGGVGGAVDVDLSLVGFCCRISPKHATIFYDDFTKTYELINYSEFGTEVNGQLYSCDFTEHGPTPAKKLRNEDVELQKRVQTILDKRRGVQRQCYVIDKNARMAPPSKPQCKCSYISEPPMLAGAWEGTAIVAHGTLLRFGCLSFVFSIPDVNLCNGQG